MNKKNSSSKKTSKSKSPENSLGKENAKQSKPASSSEEVLIKVGGFEYRTPGKRQRIVIGSIVIGLNVLLVLASVAYFYIPSFQQFIYNIGRN